MWYKSQSHSQRAGEKETHKPPEAGRKQKEQSSLSFSLWFIQTLPGLDDVHPYWEGSPAVLGSLVQVLILSRNIFGDTLTIWVPIVQSSWHIHQRSQYSKNNYQMNALLQPAPVTRDHPPILCLTLSHLLELITLWIPNILLLLL